MKIRISGIITFILLSLLASAVLAAELNSEILQLKNGRFYFPAGRENLVYPDCEFTIFMGRDSVCSGKIQMSSLGVSYSFPVEYDSSGTSLDGATAIIKTAKIDSTSTITLGSVYFNQDPYSAMFPDLFGLYSEPKSTSVFFTESGNAINIKHYISKAEMELDFEMGAIDGYFSYNNAGYCDLETSTISSPAPYFIGLIPGLAAVFNQRGLLTTSLYYRVNGENPGSLFGGDEVASQNCPMAGPDICPRPLEYNPIKGQQLLNVLKPFSAAVLITSTDREFQPTAMYFTDILWREKVETRLQLGRGSSDLYIAPIPIAADSISLSLEYIKGFICRDTVAGLGVNKNIRLLDNYINEIKATDSLDRKREYAARSAEVLWQDLGVFSLYRPSVYFIHHTNIGKVAFDKDGYLNLRKLVKLGLPGKS